MEIPLRSKKKTLRNFIALEKKDYDCVMDLPLSGDGLRARVNICSILLVIMEQFRS